MGKFTIIAPFELVDSEIIDALNFTPEDSANKDTDGALAANSDTKYPSQKAAKAYVDSLAATVAAALPGKQDGLIKSPSAIPGGIVGVDANGDIAIARTPVAREGKRLGPACGASGVAIIAKYSGRGYE